MPSTAETTLRHRYPGHAWDVVSRELPLARADVFRLRGTSDLYVKIAAIPRHPDTGLSPRAEAERLQWLGDTDIPAPSVVDAGVIDGHEFLVSTAAPGRPASDAWPAHRRMAVMDALAGFTRDLHAVPVADCPFDRGRKVTIADARQAVTLGLVDASEFDDERQGWSAEEALTALVDAEPAIPAAAEVLCHGDYCLPNVLLDPETLRVTALVDVGRFGRADRYADLALMSRSVSSPHMNHQFGLEHAERFLHSYGEQPLDRRRIAFYRLLDEFG